VALGAALAQALASLAAARHDDERGSCSEERRFEWIWGEEDLGIFEGWGSEGKGIYRRGRRGPRSVGRWWSRRIGWGGSARIGDVSHADGAMRLDPREVRLRRWMASTGADWLEQKPAGSMTWRGRYYCLWSGLSEQAGLFGLFVFKSPFLKYHASQPI
jgi:hypothetical protein